MTKILYSSRHASVIMHSKTGVIIPVYFPEGIDIDRGEVLLRDTVALFCEQMDDPAGICLSVDGERFGSDVTIRIAGEFGISTCVSPVNRGKLHAVTNGMRCLLEKIDPEYIAIVDQDGDHFANELLNFVRSAEHISSQVDTDRVFILGRRISRHRPMGFLRGELEELADRILFDALKYRAAVTDRPLHLEYANMLDEFPDFHSGYKLFGRSIAEDVFLNKQQLSGVSEDCYYRHAVEAVMVVEALENGAYMGVVNRSTMNDQPISTFGMINRIRLTADKIIWPCKRLDIPLPFVKQWLSNHIYRLLLYTLAPEGKRELEEIRQSVLSAFGNNQAGDTNPSGQPLFV